MVVRYSKRKAILTVGISIAVAAGAGFALTRPLETDDRIAAVAVGIVAAVVAVQAIRRSQRADPVLTISEEGFRDLRLETGPIPWTEIEDIAVVRSRGQRFVSLHLRHPEMYLQNFSELAKTLGKLEAAVGLGGLPIGCNGLDHTADAIAEESLRHLGRPK